MDDNSSVVYNNVFIDTDMDLAIADSTDIVIDGNIDLTSGAIIAMDAAPEWTFTDTGGKWIDADTDLLVLDHPSPDQILTYEDGTADWVVLEFTQEGVIIEGILNLSGKELSKQYFESIEQRIINLETREDQTMFTTTNILIIMLICIITVKFVIPKLTIKYILRKFANLVYKPGKKKIEEVETEWEKAKTE